MRTAPYSDALVGIGEMVRLSRDCERAAARAARGGCATSSRRAVVFGEMAGLLVMFLQDVEAHRRIFERRVARQSRAGGRL